MSFVSRCVSLQAIAGGEIAKGSDETLPSPFLSLLPSPLLSSQPLPRSAEPNQRVCASAVSSSSGDWGPRQSSGRKRISAYYEVKNRTVFVTNACTKKNQLYRQEVPERGVRSRNKRNSVRAQFKLQVYTLITQKRVDYILKLYYRHLRTQLQYKEFFDKITFIWLDSVSSFRLEWQMLFIIILFIFKVINQNASVVSFNCQLQLEHNCSNWCTVATLISHKSTQNR